MHPRTGVDLMTFNLKWSFNNSKVGKLDAVSFGIPAFESADGFKTCPMAGACAAVCYARQGTYRWPAVVAARELNLKIARTIDGGMNEWWEFVRLANSDLHRIKNKLVRVHDSGDFFNQRYLDAWIKLAEYHPGKRFYAYTKEDNP